MSEIKDIVVQGLWKNNSALVQLLGLCPLLAVTSTATNALGLGLATTLVLTLTNLTVSALRRWTPAEIRIPIYVMIIASVVSAVQMLINAYAFGLYQSLGIFIPLIVTNCIVVGRAEAFAAKKGPWLSALDGFSIGMGATGAMLELGVEGVKSYIKTIGLFNSKAENVIKTCRILLDKHNGEVPEDRAALEALPGVGRKTANVVLNTAFGWPTIAVDTHIFRVCNRTQFAPGKNVEQVEEKLLKVVPNEFKVDCHHWLILHGRYTCIARKPRCGSCLIEDLCEYKEKVDI
ncbi:electron transport complex subunit RsxE [Salmonella enterica]|nr:electron transport complex subunit RsxE [Salmonella enterica]